MHFYRRVRFHTQRNFWANLSVRVSDSGHPVMYARIFLQTSPVKKYTDACQHDPHDVIWFCIILRFYIRRNFSQHSVTRARKYSPRQNSHILHWYIHACLTLHRPLQIQFKKNLSLNISLFYSLGLGLQLRLGLHSNQPLARNWYISLQATTQISYFFISTLFSSSITLTKMVRVLDNPYSSRLFHTNENRVVLGNRIRGSQREIPLRSSIMRFPL